MKNIERPRTQLLKTRSDLLLHWFWLYAVDFFSAGRLMDGDNEMIF